MRTILLIIVLLLAAACQSATPTPAATTEAAQIALTVAPQPPAVGNTTLTIVVTRGSQPVADAQVDLHGDMTHPGMQPILASAKTDAQGMVSLPLKWTMGGDWVVTVMVTFSDNSQVSQDFNLTVNP